MIFPWSSLGSFAVLVLISPPIISSIPTCDVSEFSLNLQRCSATKQELEASASTLCGPDKHV